MISKYYIERTFTIGQKHYSEAELLATFKYIVILAEPGAGKTELMNSLAQKLNIKSLKASVFAYMGANIDNTPLVIDAVDEIAAIDQSGLHKLLATAKKSSPTSLILSSRSSEWAQSSSILFEQFIGNPVTIVKLDEFTINEQRAIFEHYALGENFSEFQTEVARFNLEMLLPNPQFLKMFADAYLESNGYFTDKRSIFSLAVERLAKETNSSIPKAPSALSNNKKISLSSEVFAKLLLSGAEGINTTEATETRMYPILSSLFDSEIMCSDILSTRLFRPADNEDKHHPVHKIVAEYCAAEYLVNRITSNEDSLSLVKCLPIIAPNNTPRDELRGLLGWMASLGNKTIQESIINVDAYAVLANGDPSQLEPSSKRLLINKLIEIEATDPYFRRGDFWRRFSVSGFFTQDVLNELKQIIMNGNTGHLRGLILELLVDSPVLNLLITELSKLVLDPNESENIRTLSSRCLLNVPTYHHSSLLPTLISEATSTSLYIAAETIEAIGLDQFTHKDIAKFLLTCTHLYPGHKERHEIVIGSRYFIKKLIAHFPLKLLEPLLDELTYSLSCQCNKESYECDCRNGISKIVGSILDRYFELASPPFEPKQVWQWICNLNFHNQVKADQSKTVEVLQNNNVLRQGIISHVFGSLTNKEIIYDLKSDKFSGSFQSHSGLNLTINDYSFLLNLAFNNENVNLWSCFLIRPNYYHPQEQTWIYDLRKLMRQHANSNIFFMKEWARFNKAIKLSNSEYKPRYFKRNNRIKRYNKKQKKINEKNKNFLNENRELIESGRHWGYLDHFANLLLFRPDTIKAKFEDEKLVKNALKNCLDFIAPNVPNLSELANLRCESKHKQSERILYAACLEILRNNGNLEGVSKPLLEALRTSFILGYQAVSEDECKTLQFEVDRLLFSDKSYAELYLRQYLEPQLAQPCPHPEIWLLASDTTFNHLREKLSIEWLDKYPNLSIDSLNTLFEIAVNNGCRDSLNKIIKERCSALLYENINQYEEDENTARKKIFWLIRGFFFLDDITNEHWDILKSPKDNLLLFEQISGDLSNYDDQSWPKLTSIKIEMILDAFFDKWPAMKLPNSWGSNSPNEEKGYRFLTGLIFKISSDDAVESLDVLKRLMSDLRFNSMNKELQSIYASQIRKFALQDFAPPTPLEIVKLLDHGTIITVEGLRELIIQELYEFQKSIHGGEFNPVDRFYEKDERLDEVRSTQIIAERLSLRLESQGITITPEHQLKDQNRSDFTASKVINGKRRLLVTEVKGQWHRELYDAASSQLYERYSIHPDAEQQGIFLVIWFGEMESVAGRKKHGLKSAQELKNSIEAKLPAELRKFIDIFVLDVSRK
ncbi:MULTISPECIES: NACHT domain-containing protein [unclassified Providencia]|uniref:NACHT domain-containing protein n=1 Tax=unclassified Providencia TaxID=2633465 RepID=UPI00234A9E12|nr:MULTISPECIES: hypothetical protein [unclassified Providencia]